MAVRGILGDEDPEGSVANPFEAVTDYPTMLNKIATATALVTIALVYLLSQQLGWAHVFVASLSPRVPVFNVDIPLAYAIAAAAVGGLSRIVKLHDRLSDLLGIRRRFDVDCILMPLVLMSGQRLTAEKIQRLEAERGRLMGEMFYLYASSTKGKAVIDTHYVTMAMDQWAWYWIILEAAALLFVGAVMLFIGGKSQAACWSLFGVLAMIWLLAVIRGLCARYALQQVREIMKDSARRQAVAGVLDAL